MAVADKKGRMHHSAGRAALQDDMDARESSKGGDGGYSDGGKKDAGAKKGGADGGDGKTDVSNMEIGEVVKKHGPAHHTVISHDDDNAMHTVTSHHGKPTAHVHHSEHGSREAAMDHANMANGMEAADQANETPGDEMDEEVEGNQQKMPSGKIPGMAAA